MSKCPYAEEEEQEPKEDMSDPFEDMDLWEKIAKIMARRHAGMMDEGGGGGRGMCQCKCHGGGKKAEAEEEEK